MSSAYSGPGRYPLWSGGLRRSPAAGDGSTVRGHEVRDAIAEIVGALVLLVVTMGITEASATRSPSMPLTRRRGSTNRHRLSAHLACPDLMVVGDRRLSDVAPEFFHRGGARPRVALDGAPLLQSGAGADAT